MTLIGAAANVFLSILKLIVGMITGSASLIADAGHGCSDLIVDGLCMLAVKAGCATPLAHKERRCHN